MALALAAVLLPGAGAAAQGPGADPTVVGQVLSANGTTLVPPKAPTSWPSAGSAGGRAGVGVNLDNGGCSAIFDPGFTAAGACAVATGPGGSVAGVVESDGAQERDLVWRRAGPHWDLVLRRTFAHPGPLSQVGTAGTGQGGRPQLVFVTASPGHRGFGAELDVVGEDGRVSLCRAYLTAGFVVATADKNLVTYVPAWAVAGAPRGTYDQMLIRDVDGMWTVMAQQYVPKRAALAQHRGALYLQTAPTTA
jgi:hypothetical protein